MHKSMGWETARAFAFGSAILAGLSQTVAAQDGSARNPVTVYTTNAEARAPGGAAEQLMQRAQSQGQIRVLVGLRMTMQMTHTLSTARAAAQTRTLQSVQQGVASRVLGSTAASRQHSFQFIPYMSMFVNPNQLQRLLADPQVASVQEDVPDAPLLADSTGLTHTDDVWAKGFSGTNQVVAILDTGVSKSHQMFTGKVVSEACYSTTSAPDNVTSVCPSGAASSTATGSGVNCPTAVSGCDHGTHVAGIAAGNSSTVDGIARDAKIIAVQVFSKNTTTNRSTSFQTDQIKGLERVYALRNTYKIAAVNMSLGGGKFAASCDGANPARTTAITNLRNAGIAVIVASGNDSYTGFISAPACISTAIAVGNTTKKDLVWRSSNHSSLVKLMAPGTDIKSAVPGNTFANKTGTSMAAPHVAGAFGLLRNAKPTATVNEMLEALTCSGKVVDRRIQANGTEVELNPNKPRIDLLGAYNHLIKPANVMRIWPFSAADEVFDWSPLRGKWALQSGNYAQTPITAGWVSSYVANCNTKLTVIARLKRTESGTTSTWNSGIVFKTASNFTKETTSGYWVAFSRCRYNGSTCVTNTSVKQGLAVFWRLDNYNLETNSGGASLLCSKSVGITVGGYNTIKVVSNGSSHTFYLNGTLACTITDATYASGGVQTIAYIGTPTAGHSLAYDSVSVQSLGSNDVMPRDEGSGEMNPMSFAPASVPVGMSPAGWTAR